MAQTDAYGLQLEKTVGGVHVVLGARADETIESFYERFSSVLEVLTQLQESRQRAEWVDEIGPDIEEAIREFAALFDLTQQERATIGLTNEYYLVMLSLMKNFDDCMGATAIAEEWGGMNTGQISRVFTASRKRYWKYKGHFQRCEERGKYRFTREGIDFALNEGIEELREITSDEISLETDE